MLTEKGVPGECVLVVGPRKQERRAAEVVQPIGANADESAPGMRQHTRGAASWTAHAGSIS